MGGATGGSSVPQMLVFFDDDANELPSRAIMDSLPRTMVDNLKAVRPTPGTGYYCHLNFRGGSYDRAGILDRYEICGPGWQIDVEVSTLGEGQYSFHLKYELFTQEALDFLAKVV
jgi:hypothetical protein